MFHFDLANSLDLSRESERGVGNFCRFAVVVIKITFLLSLFGSQYCTKGFDSQSFTGIL
jgi:hypothetical protein